MRRAVVALCCILASAGLMWFVRPGDRTVPPPAPRAQPPSAEPVLLLPGVKEPTRLRLDVLVDGQPATVAWEDFLHRHFDFFDRDGDGSLSRDEVGRMVRLPLPGRNELTIDFAKLDADGNGKGSREEWKSFCRANGFGPVVVLVEPPAAEDLRLAELLFRHLDANNDGRLAQAELRRAPRAFHSLDLNEDEFLDRAELLAAAAPDPHPASAQVKLARDGKEVDAVLRLDVGSRAPSVRIEGKGAGRFSLAAPAAPNGLHRLHRLGGHWSATFRTARVVPDVGSAGEFLVSQFTTALGERMALTKADLEEEPLLSGFLELFAYADGNGDNRLSLSELEDYLKLFEQGMRAQVWVTVTDRGRNPFHFIDADGDGRLSYRELSRVGDLLASDEKQANTLPEQFQFSFGGPVVASWGGVPIPAVVARPPPVSADVRKAPRWFQAMDRNGDRVISPREFVGPPEIFRKMDTDGDGVISAEEANRAEDR